MAEAPSADTLLSLLAVIPQDPIDQTDGFIYFADYSAMESAYSAVRPADAQEFADPQASDAAHQIWSVLFKGASWLYSPYWQVGLKTGPQMVGFSPLEVDQAVQFGVPPSDGLMLAGSFDAAAVGAAYQANVGLAAKDFDGRTVWSASEDGVDGLQVDPANILLENPFGGKLGRRQPMTISDGLLMSSADLELVLGHLDAAAGTVPSLADTPGYSDAVNAVAEEATILQATIAGPVAARQMGDELPGFELLILADVVTSDEQMARLGLVYRDAGSAESAGPLLLDSLSTSQSLSDGRPYAEILTPPKGTGPRYHVLQGSDRAVLVLEFPAPRSTPEELVAMLGGDEGTATPPGRVYRLLSQMFLQRDTGWLSAAP